MRVAYYTEYKGYQLYYLVTTNGMADITIFKRGSTKMLVGKILQMPREEIDEWFKQYIDGVKEDTNE